MRAFRCHVMMMTAHKCNFQLDKLAISSFSPPLSPSSCRLLSNGHGGAQLFFVFLVQLSYQGSSIRNFLLAIIIKINIVWH